MWDAKGEVVGMYDDDGPYLSESTYRHYMGGLMANAREI